MGRFALILMAEDFTLAVSALFVGALLRFGDVSTLQAVTEDGGLRLVAFGSAVVFSSYFCEMYSWENQLDRMALAARIAVALMPAYLILSAFYYLVPGAMVGRGFLALSLLTFGAAQFLVHLGSIKVMRYPGLAPRVLILGVGPLAEKIEQTLQLSRRNYVFAGFVQPAHDVLSVPQNRVVGSIDRINEVIREHRATKLVVSLTERRGVLPVRDLLRCKLSGVDVVDSPSFYEKLTGKLLVEDIQPSWFIYSNGFCVTPFMRFYKRVFDILFSSVGIVLALPLWPLVALMVKFDSPGPVFFKQIRVGEHDRPFRVYKFRTMRQDAEKGTGAVWAQQNDPRVTRVGAFLRKSRLDEIPQLYNVLKGDMSFVGPRPERPEFVEKLEEKIPYYSKRHFMKPGVTGWAQVCYPYGSSDEDALEKLRYDLYYIKNYSLLLDFRIILETVKVVLFHRGGR